MDGASQAEKFGRQIRRLRTTCVVFAVTDPDTRGGISAFLVPTDAPGFEIQRIIKLFGHIGGDEAELTLDDVRVEPWQLVGDLHKGFAAALYGVSLGRIQLGPRSWIWPLGAGTSARLCRRPGSLRQNNFGIPGRHLPPCRKCNRTARSTSDGAQRGHPARPRRCGCEGAIHGEAYAVQVGYKAVDRAMQTHGAMGFTNELGLYHAWHALRIVNVADGTNEILNRTIVQRLMKGDREL